MQPLLFALRLPTMSADDVFWVAFSQTIASIPNYLVKRYLTNNFPFFCKSGIPQTVSFFFTLRGHFPVFLTLHFGTFSRLGDKHLGRGAPLYNQTKTVNNHSAMNLTMIAMHQYRHSLCSNIQVSKDNFPFFCTLGFLFFYRGASTNQCFRTVKICLSLLQPHNFHEKEPKPERSTRVL